MLKRIRHTLTSIPRYIISLLIFRFVGGAEHARYCGVKVGENCRIYIRQFGTEPFLISIGDRVTITSGVKIITHDGSTILVRNDAGHRYLYYASVTIGDDVFIGINSIILPGVTIGSKVVIGAGSVVTRNIPENSVAVGNPAKVIGSFDSLKIRIMEKYIDESELDKSLNYKEKIYQAISKITS
jgi:acetyltransferase-like isoleucine patch superfamily enzyme